MSRYHTDREEMTDIDMEKQKQDFKNRVSNFINTNLIDRNTAICLFISADMKDKYSVNNNTFLTKGDKVIALVASYGYGGHQLLLIDDKIPEMVSKLISELTK